MKTFKEIFFIAMICISIFGGCNSKPDANHTNTESSNPNGSINDNLFKGKLIIILAEKLDKTSRKIVAQDYVQNGISFIPIFSSLEKFNESTQGQVTQDKIEIDGFFLLSILKGNETLRLNPSLNDEQDFQAKNLIEKYKTEIEKVKEDLESKINAQE